MQYGFPVHPPDRDDGGGRGETDRLMFTIRIVAVYCFCTPLLGWPFIKSGSPSGVAWLNDSYFSCCCERHSMRRFGSYRGFLILVATSLSTTILLIRHTQNGGEEDISQRSLIDSVLGTQSALLQRMRNFCCQSPNHPIGAENIAA